MQLEQDWLMQQGEDTMLLQTIDTCFCAPLPQRIGIAVSGGGDSVALLHLFSRWATQTGHAIAAVTVDHGLRPESRAEAEGVARLCQSLGVQHETLTWNMPEGSGNVAAAARSGRYAMMADWAKTNEIGGIALGHTIDDTAENFLMRLGRSAGIDGLAEMESQFERNGIWWSRPLWQQRREQLRTYLRCHQVEWVDDPSNDDPKYMRTLARRILPMLGELGIDADSIHHSAFALRQAQNALSHYTCKEAEKHVQQDGGDLIFPLRMEPPIPADVERRLTVAALQWVSSNPYPPRKVFAGVLAAELDEHQRVTVAGCIAMKRKGHIRITREHNAVKDLKCPTDQVWDSRWRLDGPHDSGLEIRALGIGVHALSDWRATGVARRSLMSSPAVWRGDSLVAAPLAGYNPDWTAQIVADFTSFLLLH